MGDDAPPTLDYASPPRATDAAWWWYLGLFFGAVGIPACLAGWLVGLLSVLALTTDWRVLPLGLAALAFAVTLAWAMHRWAEQSPKFQRGLSVGVTLFAVTAALGAAAAFALFVASTVG